MEDKRVRGKDNKNTFSYAFKQQIMKAWQPVPTINSTVLLFFVLSVFFLTFGIILIAFTDSIIEYSVRYDNAAQCAKIGQNCTVSI